MRDLRDELLQKIKVTLLTESDFDKILCSISNSLRDYEVVERVTSIVPSSTKNLDLVKTYVSALIIDGKQKSTIEHYARELKKFIAEFEGCDIKELKSFDIRNYLAKKKLNGLSNRTLENVRAIIMAFYGWLIAEEYIAKNPCLNIKPMKLNKEVKLPFSPVELDKIRSVCRNAKERAIIEFLLSTGVRVSEFCDLNIDNIDFLNGSVHILHGKGDKERYTYMNDLARDHLIKYLNGRCSGPLFLTKKKGAYTKGGLRFLLKRLGEKAGVDNVHPHRFRRTFATTLASRGMQVQEVQKLLGHSKINTTMVYVSVNDAQVKSSYNKYAI